MSILNAYLDAHDTQVVLVHRDDHGRRKERKLPAEWITYFRSEDLDAKTQRFIRSSAHVASVKKEDGGWLRVGWKGRHAREDITFNRLSPLVQLGVPMYEGDVDPVRRLIADVGLKIGKPRRVYLDIETDSRVPFSRKEEMRILSWALVDEERGSLLGILDEDTDASERALLDSLWAALDPYDQVVAWNGDNFDFPVLFARSEAAGITADARLWLWLDHLTLFKRMNTHSSESGEEKRSMKLENIAQATIGEGKEEVPAFVRDRFGDKSLGALAWQLWEAGGEFRRLLARYNLRDTELLQRIEKETGYIALFDTLCEVTYVFGDSRGLNPTFQMDGFMLRLGKERGHHFATKKYREVSEKFEGAWVLHPRCEGIETNVHVCDFASLYPSIILTFNMSPDTKRSVPVNGPIPEGCCRAPVSGIGFDVTVKGILTVALHEMIRLRKEWSDKKAAAPAGSPEAHDAERKSNAYKVAANSFYGVVGSPFSRFFDRSVAESVTTTGKWLLKLTIAAAERNGWVALYGDTDSCFIRGCTREEFAAFTRWCNEELYPPALKAQGCVDNFIKLAYEKEFSLLVMTTAKRYIGRFVHYKGSTPKPDAKPEIKGLEYKRGDASLLACQLQAQAIDLLVGGLKLSGDVPVPTKELEHFHAIISRMRTHVLEDPLSNAEVMLSKSVSKPLKDYVTKPKKDGTMASPPSHVQVALVLKGRGQEVSEGTRIEYVVTDGSVSPMKVIPAEDFTGSEMDRHHIWEADVFPATQKLLEAAFPDQDWVRWAKSRPPKPRGRRTKVLAGQEELPAVLSTTAVARVGGLGPQAPKVGAPSVPAARARPFHVRVAESLDPTETIARLADILRAHPGSRPVILTIVLQGGQEAVLDVAFTVSGSPALVTALAPLRATAA